MPMPIPQTASICLLHVGAYNISHFYKPLCSFPLRSSQTFLFSEADINSTPSIISKFRTTITAPPNLEVLPTSTSTFHFPLSTFHFSTCPPHLISQTLPSSTHPPTCITKKNAYLQEEPQRKEPPPLKKEKPPKSSKKCHQKISTSSPATPTNSPKSKRFCRRLPYNSHRRMWIW